MAVVYLKAGVVQIRLDKDEKWRLAGSPVKPEKVSLDKHIYAIEVNRSSVEWMGDNFSTKEIAPKCREFMRTRLLAEIPDEPFPRDHRFRIIPPFQGPLPNQARVMDRAWRKPGFGIFHEMGCGKTLSAISLISAYWEDESIHGALVTCPTSIKFNWVKELNKHWPETSDFEVWVLTPDNMTRVDTWIGEDQDKKCKVLVVGIEALSQGTAWTKAERFLGCHDALMVVDESSRIKSPWQYSARKKKVIAGMRTYRSVHLGKLAKHRLIMTGTSVTQGLQDLYSQFEFLDPSIIGSSNFYSFRNEYCVLGGAMGKQIVGYRNTNKLFGLIRPYCDVAVLDDIKDVPFLDDQLLVRMTPIQKSLTKKLKDEMFAEYEGRKLEINTILEFMLRAQQIVGGFMPVEKNNVHLLKQSESKYECEPLKENPKFDAAMDWVDGLNGKKAIIWARFIPEIEMFAKALDGYCVTFYGATSEEDRAKNVAAFEDPDSKARVFVGNPHTGGIGIDLIQGRHVLYYSNSFSLETRLQSRARSRRVNQDEMVHYVDLLSDAAIDKTLTQSIIKKMSVADYARTELSDVTEMF